MTSVSEQRHFKLCVLHYMASHGVGVVGRAEIEADTWCLHHDSNRAFYGR